MPNRERYPGDHKVRAILRAIPPFIWFVAIWNLVLVTILAYYAVRAPNELAGQVALHPNSFPLTMLLVVTNVIFGAILIVTRGGGSGRSSCEKCGRGLSKGRRLCICGWDASSGRYRAG